MNLFFIIFFTGAVVTFSFASTLFFASGAIFAFGIAVAFVAAVAVFRAAVNCAAAAAFTINGFAVIALWDRSFLLSLYYCKGAGKGNAQCKEYNSLHYYSFLSELHG